MVRDLSRSTILKKGSRLIELEETVAKGYQIIDVRSAGEFEAGSIPGATNIPLFDEDERSVIGTLYRHGGHERAVAKGFDYVEQKLSELIADFRPYKKNPIIVFCARGGMRSLSVVNLLDQSGYAAYQLEGGYKKYRHSVLDVLEKFQPNLIVIHGLTGAGKTRILQKLENGIDLEELARHRSSLFGGLDREPSNQRVFESRLAQTISTLVEEPYFIEGESRKIGRVYIPKPLALAMKRATLVNVHCSLDTRIKRIIEDYPVANEEARGKFEIILKSLKQKLGTSEVERMCRWLRDGRLYELVHTLLVDYYDKRYSRSMSSYKFAMELSSENIDEAAARLTAFRNSLLCGG